MALVYFDIDNTLYDQLTYVRQVARAIAKHFGKKRYYADIMRLWKKRGPRYPRLFDEFLMSANLYSRKNVRTCVRIYHAPPRLRLSLYKDSGPAFRKLSENGIPLGIITDGYAPMQRRKMRALGISRHVPREHIHCTHAYGTSKTDPAFWKKIRQTALRDAAMWYIGDDPAVDFKTSKRAGFITVRLRRGIFSRSRGEARYVDHDIRSLASLPALVREH